MAYCSGMPRSLRLKTNSFYKNSTAKSVVQIISEDYDHHKGITEYLVKFLKYCPISDKNAGESFWVRSHFFLGWEEVGEIESLSLEVLYGQIKRNS